MKDKLLFENWRKFLNERGESDFRDQMASDVATDAGGGEVDPIPEPVLDRPSKPPLPGGGSCSGTVGEFLKYINGVHAAIKSAQLRVKTAQIGDPKGFIPGGENVKAGIEAAELGIESLADVVSTIASADLDNDFGVKERSQAPFLEFCTIDDKYVALLSPIVIRNFLKSGYWMENLTEEDEMPDIDEKLEDWIHEHPKFKGIVLDGVSSARDDYKKWCAKDPPTPGEIMSLMTRNKIADTGKDISAAGASVKKISGGVFDRLSGILSESFEKRGNAR
jgi:hypothetical protein